MKNTLNILLIMCDQLNARALGCYGGQVPTPNIDRLAGEGVLFTDATCAYPICSPSRASIITGQYAHKHGLTHNCMRYDYLQNELPETEEGIFAKDITTESVMNANGYETHHYGKWHLLGEMPPYYPDMYLEHHQYAKDMKEKFDSIKLRERDEWMDWYGWALPVKISDKHREAIKSVGNQWDHTIYAELIKKAGRLDLDIEDYYDHRIAQKTMEEIKRDKNKPFMITCSFNNPHDPNVIPSPYYEMFDPEKIVLPDNYDFIEQQFANEWSRDIVVKPGEDTLRELMRIYYAQVKLADDEIGRILKTLDDEGLTDNTIVVFTADHGDMMGGHGMFWKSSGNLYDEIIRVPLIMRCPGVIKPATSKAAVSGVDIMPTLLALAGQPIPQQAQGYSLAMYLTGQPECDEAPGFSFCERIYETPGHMRRPYDRKAGGYAVRGSGWKYIVYKGDNNEIQHDYLYHLEKDPGETVNLAQHNGYAMIKSELSMKIEDWLKGENQHDIRFRAISASLSGH